MPTQTFVIVGASLAGAKAAEALRDDGFDGRVVLIGEEPARPYERPPLSKAYLRSEVSFGDFAVHPEGYYAERAIELLTSTVVTALDPQAQVVTLEPGGQLAYDRLLLAPGAAPRVLSVPGADLAGAYYLRTLESCDALRAAFAHAAKVVVVGAGWIGSEVAASARLLGKEVALVEFAQVPLERVLGAEVGQLFRDLHAEHGVELHMGVGVDSFRGSGSIEEVVLSDGSSIEGDVFVVGVGVRPRVELAEGSGLELDNGILTDEYLKTSVGNVFAAGDVANAWHPVLGRRIRLEHWSAALNQGPAAARNMLGEKVAYDKVPYFFSDQYDLGMEYSGFAEHWDQIVYRGDPAAREMIVFWLQEGRVLAGMNVNVWDVADEIADLVRAKRPIDVASLADPDVPLSALLRQ